jgi:hypothetical protein
MWAITRKERPEYDATVGAAVRFQRNYDGKQPGDPAKAGAEVELGGSSIIFGGARRVYRTYLS